jgi:hypothetical protein
MGAVAHLLWPQDEVALRDPNTVRWQGAIVSLHVVEDHLYVAWKDEDHWDKFGKVAELAWYAVGHEGGRVLHENADTDGLELPVEEPLS